MNSVGFSAQGETRTRMPLTALPPQSSMSTNFTTWAVELGFKYSKY